MCAGAGLQPDAPGPSAGADLGACGCRPGLCPCCSDRASFGAGVLASPTCAFAAAWRGMAQSGSSSSAFGRLAPARPPVPPPRLPAGCPFSRFSSGRLASVLSPASRVATLRIPTSAFSAAPRRVSLTSTAVLSCSAKRCSSPGEGGCSGQRACSAWRPTGSGLSLRAASKHAPATSGAGGAYCAGGLGASAAASRSSSRSAAQSAC